MKKLLGMGISKYSLVLIMLVFCFNSNAQTFGNEWINYAQGYAKFGVAEDGIYRISNAQLLSSGITNPNGGQLQIFRDGKQVPIYVSNSGSFGGADYMEFHGRMADGEVDKGLYLDPNVQMNSGQNLISDTAYYFITQSTSGPYSRVTVATNNLTGAPTKESYVWDTVATSYRGALSQGPSYIGSSLNPILYLRSSQFEEAEGWVSNLSFNIQTLGFLLPGAYKGVGSPNATVKTTIAGFSYLPTHSVKIEANNVQLANSTFPRFTAKEFSMSMPTSVLGTNNVVNLKYTPQNSQPGNNLYDRIGIANILARYARTNNFSGLTSEYFELNPKTGTYYLEFDNFNTGGTAPWLYDLVENRVYAADIGIANKVRFQIPANASIKKLYLVGRQAGVAKNVNNLHGITFKNYSNATNQGDYIIITDPYYFDGNGTNYVDDYKNFRSSITGGGYAAIIASVGDIYNEFGYGYTFHAQAIRNFLSYSHKSSAWNNKSKFAFLIGKGILYSNYKSYSETRQTTPSTFPYVPIPTFGVPASDILLTDFDNDNIPELPIGRLSVLNGSEIATYLEKVQIHETGQSNTSNQYVDSVLWQKRVLHVAGAENQQEQAPILVALNRQGGLIKDTCFGAIVPTYAKSKTASVQQEATEAIDAAVNAGSGFIQYFGHGSSSTLAFGFDRPEQYIPNNRFSIFMANGCGVGNVFSIGAVKTLSERWIEEPNKGSIGFIANSNTGFLYYLANYTDSFYQQMTDYRYGKTIGEQFVGNVTNTLSYPNILNNNVARFHAEQMLLQGDPAVSMYGAEKPDYAVEEKYARIKQISITTQMDTFDVELVVYNLGKYSRDSLDLIIERILPNSVTELIQNTRIGGLANTDTINLRIPVGGSAALGINTLHIKIDNLSEIDEVAEYNNEINKTFSIYNDDLEPIYPFNFSIINDANLTLKASTLNPFLETRQYVLQVDTTESFNSISLQTTRINSKGGVVKWKPTINYQDSVVYYWRTAMDTIYGNKIHRWTASSFIYLPNAATGWNQSHYYQYQKNNLQNIQVDSLQRNYKFTSLNKKLQIQNVCMNGPAPYSYYFPDYSVKLDGTTLYTHGCAPAGQFESLQFVLIDSLTGMPWKNQLNTATNRGRFGSWKPCREETFPSSGVFQDQFFEFSFNSPAWRQTVMNFIDSIPDGTYVMMQPRLCLSATCGGLNTFFVADWKADTASLGSGNSLYHKVKDLGFTEIDSLYKNRSMIFFRQKGVANTVQQHIGADSTVKLYREIDFKSYLYEGKIVSTKIGPSTKWDNFHRSGFDIDNGLPGDSVSVEIYGIDVNNGETLLATVHGDTNLSFIDASVYPCLRLGMNQTDINYSTPEQVKYWRVHYTPVPEAALNPKVYYNFTDSLIQGQENSVALVIENLTDIPMDSMLVNYSLIDANNTEVPLESIRYKPLPGNDTLLARVNVNSENLSGKYFLKIEANPNKDQLEQYHPNNIGFKEFYVQPDNKNPILDVTFDGVHILNRDIVSAKPTILISLKDENQFLALDDTSSFTVSLRYPSAPNVDIPISFNDPAITFIPANPGSDGENKARIEFRPTFLEDGIYELVVEGKDKLGNFSGNVSYKIAFEVITKSSVTSVLNYPNPFSTSTQFVFTLTGSEVPEQFKIQIYSVTGKVVREISRAEIGNIHIGRNITEFRWKGDDQYGDLLGNGVYLYRVITRLNGQVMDKAETDPAGNWVRKGFGKLYIMR